MPNERKDLLSFGPFRLDPAERRLLRGETLIPVTSKALDVLELLVRNAGRTVTKDEFMASVWAGTVVEEGNLTDNISTLRQALEDDAKEPKYIETVPRRGYRFVAAVDQTHVEQTLLSAPSKGVEQTLLSAPSKGVEQTLLSAPSKGVEQTLLSAKENLQSGVSALRWGLAIVAILVIAALVMRRDVPPSSLRSIAVFPFDPLGTDAGETHLGVSLADSLITRLTSIDELIVRPAGAVLGGPRREPIVAAREQGVDAYVEGRVRKRDGRIRVTVQLVSVAEARTLWARTFDESAANLFEVEDRIAEEVARELSVRTSKVARQYTPDPAAYELYGAGRYFWSQRTAEALEKSIDCFQRAIAIDPRFALAHAGLADAYSAQGLWNFKAPRETYPRARAAAEQALKLDAGLAEARTSLAYVKFRYDWDLAGAEDEFRRALAARPNYPTARALYAEYLVVMQRNDEAEAALERARALDPRSPYIAMMAAVHSYFMRDYARAARDIEAVLRRDPDFFIAREFLWAVYREAGDQERSVAMRLATLPPSAADLQKVFRTSGIEAYRRAENQFLESESQRRYVPAVFLAMNHAENGENDLAMLWLEKAHQERSGWLLELRPDPAWDAIRGDPRFIALTERVYAGR